MPASGQLDRGVSDPFDGIGKPEPLKYLGAYVWSRRVTQSTVAWTWSRSMGSSFCKAAATIEFWAQKTANGWRSHLELPTGIRHFLRSCEFTERDVPTCPPPTQSPRP